MFFIQERKSKEMHLDYRCTRVENPVGGSLMYFYQKIWYEIHNVKKFNWGLLYFWILLHINKFLKIFLRGSCFIPPPPMCACMICSNWRKLKCELWVADRIEKTTAHWSLEYQNETEGQIEPDLRWLAEIKNNKIMN